MAVCRAGSAKILMEWIPCLSTGLQVPCCRETVPPGGGRGRRVGVCFPPFRMGTSDPSRDRPVPAGDPECKETRHRVRGGIPVRVGLLGWADVVALSPPLDRPGPDPGAGLVHRC